MKFVAAKCPSCGADINVPDNKDFAYCTFCGSNVKVRESVIMKSDVDTDNLVKLGNIELQAKDYNEAMDYFTRVLEVDGKDHRAWVGRGQATIRKSNTQLTEYEEAMVYFENAVENCEEAGKEDLVKSIIGEFGNKVFYPGHIEFLDKLVKMNPSKQLILKLILLLDVVEADMSKSGNKLSPERQSIRTDALAILKENYPDEYDKYHRQLENKAKGLINQAEDNAVREYEKKRRYLFSGKRIFWDIVSTSMLNVIITGTIMLCLNLFGSFASQGVGRFIAIFLVLTFFGNLAVYTNKRRQLKELKVNLSNAQMKLQKQA